MNGVSTRKAALKGVYPPLLRQVLAITGRGLQHMVVHCWPATARCETLEELAAPILGALVSAWYWMVDALLQLKDRISGGGEPSLLQPRLRPLSFALMPGGLFALVWSCCDLSCMLCWSMLQCLPI